MPSNWKNQSPNLLAPVMLDGMNVSEIWIFTDADKLLIDQKEFFDLMQSVLKMNYFEKLLELKSDANYFSEQQLENLGMDIQFDMASLNLYLKIPLNMRKSNFVDLLSKRSSRGLVIGPSNFSYYLNFNYNNSYIDGISDREQLYNELNLNYKGHILNSGGYYNSDNRKRYHREYTRYIHDLEKDSARFMLGDINHNTVDLQEQFKGLGFTLQNDFSINPNILRTNFNQYEVILREPSLVEIFLNNSRIYRARHPAGPLNVNRLPLAIGLNEIEVLVTSDSGRSETFRFQTNYHNNLLPNQIKDYSINVLISSEYNDENDLEYRDDKKFISGYYRKGHSDSLTYGINFQGQDKNNLVGVELSKSFSRILMQGFYTNSYYNNENKTSYLLALQNNPSPSNLKPIRFNASYRFFEKDFTYATGSRNNIKLSQILGSSYILNSASSFGLSLETRLDYDGTRSEFTNLEYIYRLNVNTNFSIKTQIDNLEQENNSILLSLNWFEQRFNRFSGNHSYNSNEKRFRNQVNYRDRFESKKLLMSATQEESKKENIKFSSLYANLDTTEGAIKLDHFDNNGMIINNLNLQFALVGANSRPHLSRYITNSFIVVNSTSDSTIDIGNEFTSSVNKKRPVVINNLTAYQNNNIPLELSGLEFGEDLAYDYLTVKPKYLSGSYLNIATTKQTSIGFKIRSTDTDNIRYQPITLMNDNHRFETISGKRGTVFIEKIAPGTYSLFCNDKLIKVIDIANKPGYLELGEVNID